MKYKFLNKVSINRLIKLIKRFLQIFLIIFGSFSLLLLILSFTTLPFWLYYWLGTSNSEIQKKPAYIIMLSGNGMPSESGLIRTYYTSQLAIKFPEAKVIIAMPETDTSKNSASEMIKDEIILRGGCEENILFENKGTNTRSQAMYISTIIDKHIVDSSIVLVTSPEHMFRAVLTFKKVGFQVVGGYPTFENAIPSDITFDDKKLGGRTIMIPNIGNNINIRYQFWNHLKYEIIILREYSAIFFYWLKGWI